MNRIWLVDNAIPVQVTYGGGALPSRFEASVVQNLIETAADQWEEPSVLELCRALCAGDFVATFFTSPEQMLKALTQDASPPHAVIFDWDYPGSTDESNRMALNQLLDGAFVYAQIYTQLGPDAVEPKVHELRKKFGGRLLPTKGKADVTPAQLREDILRAWEGTVAGDIADKVRRSAITAVERTLIDIGTVPRAALAAMADGTTENLVHLVLAKVRDEIGEAGFEALSAVFRGAHSAETTESVRRLLSVWYYYFPSDDRVRRGDLVDIGTQGEIGFVVTPPCDLVNFPRKAGRRLTWVQIIRLDTAGLAALNAAEIKFSEVGHSIISNHGKVGDKVIILPNVPLKSGDRENLGDYAILCHAWKNELFEGAPIGSPLEYKAVPNFSRRCTLADPYASGVIARIMTVISSPGTPDFPDEERSRLNTVVAPPVHQ